MSMYKQFAFLLIAIFSGLGLLFILADEHVQPPYSDLPWQIDAHLANSTDVLGLEVGKDSLRDIASKLKKIPEVALFESGNKKVIEAYFGSLSVGALKARIIAEPDYDLDFLQKHATFNSLGKPMPSGQRKYSLDEKAIDEVNALRIWKLAYIPVIDYQQGQIEQFFGKPNNIEMLQSGNEYWHYPMKGLVISYSKTGGEVFYYVSRLDYDRLLDNLSR